MTHLSPGELTSWFERGAAEDRERVIAHLAECADCRKALAMLAIADEALGSTPPIVSAAEAVPHGYAARREPPAARGAWPWLHNPLVRFAGALAVVALVIWATTPTVNETPRTVRVVAEASWTAEEFRWESPFQADSYRFSLRDSNGVLLFSGLIKASPYRPEPSLRSQLKPGELYTWKVESLDSGGAVIAESVPVTFRYQP